MRAALLGIALLLSLSLYSTARVPLLLKIVTAALTVLAGLRPVEALIALSGLLPVSHVVVTKLFDASLLALAEAWVLAFLAGYLIAGWRKPDDVRVADPLTAPVWVFAAVVLASSVVQFVVVRVWHDYPVPYARTFFAYLTRDYLTTVPDPRPWVEGHGFVATAASLLEGVSLLVVSHRLIRTHGDLAPRLLRMVVIGGIAAASINVSTVAESLLRRDLTLSQVLDEGRLWTGFIPSPNTTGPYFMLVAFLAGGHALTERRKVTWIGATILAVLAMWLAGTRSARVAGAAVAGAAAVWAMVTRVRRWPTIRGMILVGLGALVLAAIIVAANPFGILGFGAHRSLSLRVLLAESAIRIFLTHPWFGIGVGQYGLWYPNFAPRELFALMRSADAHNYFLWVAAELGLAGLAALLWILGTAARLVGKHLLHAPGDFLFLALSGGLGAFVFTWVSGQPLSVPLVGFTFWILLGAATGTTHLPEVPPATVHAPRASSERRRVLSLAAACVVAISIPARIEAALAEVDFSRISYGFEAWETEGDAIRYRWTGPRATLFVPTPVRAAELPLRAFSPAALGIPAFDVHLFVDRRRAGLVTLTDDRWHEVRVPGPTIDTGKRFWRIDLAVTPTWRPADHLPGSQDHRALGVKVGEIRLLR